jgi:hypothetical protein
MLGVTRPASALALAVLGFAAWGCGGGGGGSSTSKDEAALRKLIVDASTTNDPAKCTTAATQRFLEQIQLEKGSKAVEACKKDAKTDRPAKSVDIANVDVNGTKATATYTQNGGDADGQTGTVEFVKTGGNWRFDHVAAMKIDRPKFDRAMRRSLVSPPNELSASVADCSIREVDKLSDAVIENAVVDSKLAVLARPVAQCALVEELTKGKISATAASCAARRTIAALSDTELEESVNGGSQAAIESALRKALVACGAGSAVGGTS